MIDRNNPKVFSRFNSMSPEAVLPSLCLELFTQQQSTWHQMKEGYDSLQVVQVREIFCRGFTVHVQFNPKRIVSTGADIDPSVIRNRKCFLCLENLPGEQQGILYHDAYVILCNPVPIFSKHYTVASVRHIPQDFESSFDTMLDLARDLHPDYSIFYNGPECGASAPDHLHFQVSPRRDIPVERDAVDARRRKRFYYKNHVAGFTLMNYGRTVMVIESSDKNQLIAFIQTLFTQWKSVLHLSKEPLTNVLCSYQENIWRLILFPRRKHRPEIYYSHGEHRFLISPAAVDMGGLIVTPLEKDYLKVHATLIEAMYAEVSETQEVVDKILEKLI